MQEAWEMPQRMPNLNAKFKPADGHDPSCESLEFLSQSLIDSPGFTKFV